MNPVQFKISSVEDNNMTKVKGMTVFNTEQVNTKKQPMFFGKPLGIQRYDSYKYPVFDKLTTQQLGYFLETRRSFTAERPWGLSNTSSRTKAYLYL